MSSETTQTLETELEAAGERLGLQMQSASPEEKQLLLSIKEKVDELAVEQEQQGRAIDRSAFFAAAIAVDERFTNAAMIAAAHEYLERDHRFMKSLKDT